MVIEHFGFDSYRLSRSRHIFCHTVVSSDDLTNIWAGKCNHSTDNANIDSTNQRFHSGFIYSDYQRPDVLADLNDRQRLRSN